MVLWPRFEYDDRTKLVKASSKVLNAMRKVEAGANKWRPRAVNEARDLIQEEKDHFKRWKSSLADAGKGFLGVF